MMDIGYLETLREEVLEAKFACEAACKNLSEKSSRLVDEVERIVKMERRTAAPVIVPGLKLDVVSPVDSDFGPRHESMSVLSLSQNNKTSCDKDGLSAQRQDSISSASSSTQLRSCLRSPISVRRKSSSELMLSPRQRRLDVCEALQKSAKVPFKYMGTAGLVTETKVVSCVVILDNDFIYLYTYEGDRFMKQRVSELISVSHCQEVDIVRMESENEVWLLYIHFDLKSASGLRMLDCLEELLNCAIEKFSPEINDFLREYMDNDKAMYPIGSKRASVNENANVRNEYFSTVDSDSSRENMDELDESVIDEQKKTVKEFRGLSRVSTGTRFIQLPERRKLTRVSTNSRMPKPSSPVNSDISPSPSPVSSLNLCRSGSDTPSSLGPPSRSQSITSTPREAACKIAPQIRAYFHEMRVVRSASGAG